MARTPRPLLAYYSRTGTTETVARAVKGRLDDPAVEVIRPTRRRRYVNWLARSFVPGSTVPIEPVETDPRDRSVAFLGTPKWTFSCPPVTAYLERVRYDGASVGLFVTYGGFDEERYARGLAERLRALGAAHVTSLLVKRDRVGGPDIEAAVESFVAETVAGANATGQSGRETSNT